MIALGWERRRRMENLKTYNQVRQLDSPVVRGYWLLLHSSLLLLAVASLLAGFFYYPAQWPLGLLVFSLLLVVQAALLRYSRHRRHFCRFCATPLQWVDRPFYFSEEHFGRQGMVYQGEFYLRHSSFLAPQPRWFRVGKQSLACHHCRLHEQSSQQRQEPVPDALAQRLSLEWLRQHA